MRDLCIVAATLVGTLGLLSSPGYAQSPESFTRVADDTLLYETP